MEMINVSGYVAQEKLAIAEVGGVRGLEGRAQDQIWFSVVPCACLVLGRGLGTPTMELFQPVTPHCF